MFPALLKKAREIRELNQAELATRTGLQPSAISHFEAGTRKPSFANLRKLADALNVSTDFLLGRSDSMEAAATADILYRDYGNLSDQDQEHIRMLVQVMKDKDRGKKS